MAIPQEKFREMVFQLLYSMAMGDSQEGDLVPFLMKELRVSRKNVESAFTFAQEAWEKREELDEKIAETSRDFALERIGTVERTILRLALFEMESEDVPPKVVMSEAVRMARKFSTPEGSKFVNAIVDAHAPALSPSV